MSNAIFASFTDFKRIQLLLIAYVFEKTFYFTSILRQACNNPEEHLERGKILVLEKTFSFQLFSDFEQNIFGLLAENFGQGCQKFILRVQRNILRKNMFFEVFF